ncbi:MAG TPA: PAS domain S-box protein, partial [Spirochaetota bacterium]|nr:PAS domain S-box protein [Spirochaetota bacterium]
GVDGRMQYVSPSCEVITGFTASEFMENPGLLSKIVFPEDSNSPCLSHEAVFETPAVNETEFRIKTKNGEIRWIAHACRAVYDKSGKFSGRRGSNRDITLRKEMEAELHNTYSRVERLWHIATLSGADMKTICDSILQSITMITESPYGFYGFMNDDETVMTIHSWSGLAMEHCSMADKPADFIISECGIWAEAVRNRGDLLINDYSIEHPAKKGYPEGHVKLEKLMVIPVFKGEKIIAIGAVANKKDNYNNKDALIVRTFMANVQSVIDRKMSDSALKDSEKKLKILMNATTDGAFLMDKNGVILEANSTLAARFGKKIEELDGLNIYSVLPENLVESRRIIIDKVISTCEPAHFEDERNGIMLESNVYPIIDSTGEVSTVAVFSRDITERKRSETEIKSLLEQKEMLLREVHHRIKNNMNTVAGLLKLQSLSIEEPAAIEALNDARGRVQNMMLIYDRLYRSADYKNLNVKDYFENLVNEIIKLFPNHSKVNVVKKIDDFKLDSKVLFTMGIMINELITNTFKYAFDETDNPELAFSLSFNDGRVSFAVKDNGPGLPDNVKTGNRNGFGLNLVSSLAEQLEGEMVFGDTPGTEIKVSFTL